MKYDDLVHRFPDPAEHLPLPEKFTYPFCYTPSAITKEASRLIMESVEGDSSLAESFSEGKMLGVLVIRDINGKLGFLAGFSGLAGGKSTIPGFVPPILDLSDPKGHFKMEEIEISRINVLVNEILESPETADAAIALEKAEKRKEKAVSEMKERMKLSKIKREKLRSSTDDKKILDALTRESQFEKASLKRLSAACNEEILKAKKGVELINSRIETLRNERALRSEALQKWIFENSSVENALGDRKNILQIFEDIGIVPPGGTGECAAPKLLHYAYTHGFTPVSMGEFWYCGIEDKSDGAHREIRDTRLHGRFYPSCKGKCGPLLGFMLKGLDIERNPLIKEDLKLAEIGIIYEDDDILTVNKPEGILSTPGKTGSKSVMEILEEGGKKVFGVHRLDMDTSGVLIFAKNEHAAKILQKEFASRTAKKEYIALLETGNACLKKGDRGRINLPLCADYDDRPRQKADYIHGKEAITEYEVISGNKNHVRVLFRPITGRTHQLIVHSAHPAGLRSPIAGDRLYGSGRDKESSRLYLHAMSVTFIHPTSGKEIKIAVPPEF